MALDGNRGHSWRALDFGLDVRPSEGENADLIAIKTPLLCELLVDQF